ncbi:YbgA family protein [Sporosarcina cyprini]|uniref:YbgA family protein n=1 Tax=Sporosarcina cyprini TaxID=2910523 RepID=UPI001EDE0307|nr:YbgA family protein [Sporosarcina cyprini]MCG3088441.1 YbgA family protein [Sporosarcina cyprini]
MNDLTKKQQLWSREKYRVMFHSQKHYNEIREVLKQGKDIERVDQLIEEAGKIEPTKGSVSNAYQHMWGYFKKNATEEEREAYRSKLDAFMDDKLGSDDLLAYLKRLAVKYGVEYLLKSTILKSGIGE